MQTGFWDAEGLKGIRTPILFVAGSVDDVAGYEKGARALFEGALDPRSVLGFHRLERLLELLGAAFAAHLEDALFARDERGERLELLYLLVYLLSHRNDVTAEYSRYGDPYRRFSVVSENVFGRVRVVFSDVGDVSEVDEAVAPAAAN